MMKEGYKFRNINEDLCYVRVGSDMYQRRGGWKYFKSEAKLQTYMLENKIIGYVLYVFNVLVRFIIQVAMPNSVRSFVFRKLMRYRAD
jgi:hypothetical protein